MFVKRESTVVRGSMQKVQSVCDAGNPLGLEDRDSARANACALCSRRGGVWERQCFSNLFPSFGTYSAFLPVFQEPITIIGQKAHLDFSIHAPLEAR